MDNTQKTQKSINEELQYLWENRQTLNNEQWNRLILIVYSALHKFNHSILLNFENLEKSDLIGEFLIDKVHKTDSLSKCNSISYLCYTIFINFLKDKLRINKRQKIYNMSYDTVVKESIKNNNDSPKKDYDEISDTVENRNPEIYKEYISDSKFSTLHDLHKTYEEIEDSAKQWLSQQEHWVKIFLGRSYCPDSENSEALNKLAKRENIKSYAYKAEQLGFNWKRENNTNKKFENTMIGQWISTLDIEISVENMEVVAKVLKILCLTALSLVDEENI